MRAWSVVAVSIVMAGACSRGGSGGAKPATTAAPSNTTAAARSPTCVADSLGPLDSRKSYLDCTGIEGDCRAACDRDEVEACFGLALVVQQAALAMEDARDSPSEVKSNALYKKACVLGAPNACTNHAAHLWAFPEDTADYDCAQRIFETTCEHDDPFGCGMAARILLDHPARPDDEPDEKDVSRARALLERSCRQLEGFPCHVLALYYERGTFGPVPPLGVIKSLMQIACDGGDDKACGEFTTVAETFRR